MNNNVPDIHVVQKCSVPQLMAGVDIISHIREEEYSDEVSKYIACCAIDWGVTYLPPPLDFASEELSEPQYRCLECGNVEDYDPGYTRCDNCTERFGDHRPFNNKPIGGLPKDVGSRVEIFLKRDPKLVRGLFDLWKGRDTADVDDRDAAQLQAAKLVVGHKYMLQRRQELVEQLEELKSWVTH